MHAELLHDKNADQLLSPTKALEYLAQRYGLQINQRLQVKLLAVDALAHGARL